MTCSKYQPKSDDDSSCENEHLLILSGTWKICPDWQLAHIAGQKRVDTREDPTVALDNEFGLKHRSYHNAITRTIGEYTGFNHLWK
jgi:hypothetical protein